MCNKLGKDCENLKLKYCEDSSKRTKIINITNKEKEKLCYKVKKLIQEVNNRALTMNS